MNAQVNALEDNQMHTYMYLCSFRIRTVYLDIIRVFYLPTDAQVNYFKRNIKIYIKTAPTCFGLITVIRKSIIRACYMRPHRCILIDYFNNSNFSNLE